MKKIISLLLCVSLLVCALTGCGCTPQEQKPADKPVEYSKPSELPSLFDDTAESPLGQFDETSVFGILLETNKDGMVLEMQSKLFLFHWTETAKRHYDLLKVRPGNEIGVQFEVDGDRLIANSVELVN